MDARRPCPDSALLAAFLDGSLSDYERTAVVSHLAECAECRAVAMTVVEFREVEALDALWEHDVEPRPPAPLVESPVARWTREKTRAPALAVAITAALAALAVPLYFVLPGESAQHAVASLIEVAEGQRPVEGRLTGTDLYAPPPSLSGGRAIDDRAHVELITTAANVRLTYAAADNAPSRRAVGVAAMLLGDLDEAIATLEIAAAAAPDSATIANDLAAAYYERAVRANRPDDLPAALSVVERVLSDEPAHREALFNRALIISALGLRSEAEAAWRSYIDGDPRSPWADEARQRLQAITPAMPTRGWPALKQALDVAPRTEDAARAVTYHASAARAYFESELLERWIDMAAAGDANADALVSRMRILAAAFETIAGDHLYADFLRARERAWQQRAAATFIGAHEAYSAALALSNGLRFAEAIPALQRAHARLVAVRSPLAGRVQIELAASLYYSVRYREAAALLGRLKPAVQERRHSILSTRAAWLEGMTAFSLNDFAHAQRAYEDMLNSASAAGDLDQWVMANALLAALHDTLGNSQRAWQHRTSGALRLAEVHAAWIRSLFLFGAAGDSTASGRHAAALLFHSMLLDGSPELAPTTEVQVRAQRARSLHELHREAEARRELGFARQRLAGIVDLPVSVSPAS
jgi:tetratricopeptide (TPR) repeat protein